MRDKEIASTESGSYISRLMLFHWLQPGFRAAAILMLPIVAVGQPPATPNGGEKLVPRTTGFSLRSEPMVDIAKVCPDISIELRYATDRNLAHRTIYPLNAHAFVRKSVARRLQHAQDELHKVGLGLKIWDAYRPAWAQDLLWKASPNAEFLASPARGGSFHTWGASVDVTLVDLRRREQKMATDFDDLTEAAKSEYAGKDVGIAARMRLLRNAMLNAGFNGIHDEWWHFTARDGGLFAPVDMPLTDGSN